MLAIAVILASFIIGIPIFSLSRAVSECADAIKACAEETE